MSTYILQKDLPDAKAGTEFISDNASTYIYDCSDGTNGYYQKNYIENNPEWFKRKQQQYNHIMEDFKWTDELVKEYATQIHNEWNKGRAVFADQIMSRFKQSKQQSNKLPLGIMPLWLHNEKRLEELNAAIKRFEDAGRDIPTEWTDEKLKLCSAILEHRNNKQSNKDWEIIDCISFVGDSPHKYNEEACFSGTKPCTIHSVRRLSDNEVFTVGDKITVNVRKPDLIETISSFGINDSNKIYISYQNDSCGGYTLDEIKKAKPILFTTEDGKDIYEGDKHYPVSDDFQLLYTSFATKADIGIRTFSTEDAAKEYILYNKPCLSLNDIGSVCGGNIALHLIQELKKLAQQKINNTK